MLTNVYTHAAMPIKENQVKASSSMFHQEENQFRNEEEEKTHKDKFKINTETGKRNLESY